MMYYVVVYYVCPRGRGGLFCTSHNKLGYFVNKVYAHPSRHPTMRKRTAAAATKRNKRKNRSAILAGSPPSLRPGPVRIIHHIGRISSPKRVYTNKSSAGWGSTNANSFSNDR